MIYILNGNVVDMEYNNAPTSTLKLSKYDDGKSGRRYLVYTKHKNHYTIGFKDEESATKLMFSAKLNKMPINKRIDIQYGVQKGKIDKDDYIHANIRKTTIKSVLDYIKTKQI